MKEIIFGTTNEAKIKQVRGALSPAGISVEGILHKEMLPEVAEDGKTAVENARKKAIAYAKALSKTVFAMDNALYFDGLKDEEQPGLNVRRMKGYPERPTDEQMLEYYSQLVESLGGKTDGYWEFGVCIASPESVLFSKQEKRKLKQPKTVFALLIIVLAVILGRICSLHHDIIISGFDQARDLFTARSIWSEILNIAYVPIQNLVLAVIRGLFSKEGQLTPNRTTGSKNLNWRLKTSLGYPQDRTDTFEIN